MDVCYKTLFLLLHPPTPIHFLEEQLASELGVRAMLLVPTQSVLKVNYKYSRELREKHQRPASREDRSRENFVLKTPIQSKCPFGLDVQ